MRDQTIWLDRLGGRMLSCRGWSSSWGTALILGALGLPGCSTPTDVEDLPSPPVGWLYFMGVTRWALVVFHSDNAARIREAS